MVDENRLARDAAQRIARESYGKLVAFLARRTRDVAAAEDALSEAFAAALVEWPRKGVPQNPEGWLMAVAKRKTIDAVRRMQSGEAASQHLKLLAEEFEAMGGIERQIPDERLALMFACAHPAIDPTIRTPLILQTVLGLDAADIGSAFLVTPAAMGQRLARAKHKIKVAAIPFRVPDRAELGERLDAVLEAVYAAYSNGWSDPANAQNNLADEAIWLGRLIAGLLPGEPEALGLLALMLFLQSRCNARRSGAGEFVPLSEQDPGAWNGELVDEAERLLRRASAMKVIGRFQMEAAIQSVHAARRFTGATDWKAIVGFYGGLYELTGSAVVAINHAVALAEVEGADAGIAALPKLSDNPELVQFQPYYAARAALLAQAGQLAEARLAYDMAIGLETDPAIRLFLQSKANSKMQ
jgi:RNA polymerase sigma-70 factor (ECF subfamily)